MCKTSIFLSIHRFAYGQGKSGLGYYIDAAEMKKHAKQILKNAKISTEVKASIPIATTIIAMSDGKSKKKAKKDLEERRQSGDFPPAASVRVDDLASLEADDESKADRKVRFGKPQSKGGSATIFFSICRFAGIICCLSLQILIIIIYTSHLNRIYGQHRWSQVGFFATRFLNSQSQCPQTSREQQQSQ